MRLHVEAHLPMLDKDIKFSINLPFFLEKFKVTDSQSS